MWSLKLKSGVVASGRNQFSSILSASCHAPKRAPLAPPHRTSSPTGNPAEVRRRIDSAAAQSRASQSGQRGIPVSPVTLSQRISKTCKRCPCNTVRSILAQRRISRNPVQDRLCRISSTVREVFGEKPRTTPATRVPDGAPASIQPKKRLRSPQAAALRHGRRRTTTDHWGANQFNGAARNAPPPTVQNQPPWPWHQPFVAVLPEENSRKPCQLETNLWLASWRARVTAKTAVVHRRHPGSIRKNSASPALKATELNVAWQAIKCLRRLGAIR